MSVLLGDFSLPRTWPTFPSVPGVVQTGRSARAVAEWDCQVVRRRRFTYVPPGVSALHAPILETASEPVGNGGYV